MTKSKIVWFRGYAMVVNGDDPPRVATVTERELAEEVKQLESQVRHLERLRPVWTAVESTQGANAALAQLWEILGADNQTQAVINARNLVELSNV